MAGLSAERLFDVVPQVVKSLDTYAQSHKMIVQT
jgi:hypothetical protein